MSRWIYLHDCVVQQEPLKSERPRMEEQVGALCSQSVGRLIEKLSSPPGSHCPIFFGSGFGVLASLHDFDRVSVEQGPLRVNPSRFPDTVLNAPACRASICHGLTAPIYNLSDGQLSGLDALGLAMTQIAAGQTDEAIVCAAEEASPIARLVAPSLSTTSGVALYLSAEKSWARLCDYQRQRVRRAAAAPPPAGCVEPLLRLCLAFQKRVDKPITLTARQDDCISCVRMEPLASEGCP